MQDKKKLKGKMSFNFADPSFRRDQNRDHRSIR